MIENPRFIPLTVHFNNAAIARLDKRHSKIATIEKDTRIKMSGYRGEVQTDFHLQFLDDENHHIFRGLRLPHPQHYFQIDTLILTRMYILLIETKNHPGLFYIDKEQCSQMTDYGEKGYKNPLHQVNTHKELLQDWLEAHHFNRLPIITQVVLSHPTAIIKTTDRSIYSKICKLDKLKSQVLNLVSSCSKELLTDTHTHHTRPHLLKDDAPHYPDILTTYAIPHSDLPLGIQCPACLSFHMQRKDRVWFCPHCDYHSRYAHREALLDYFLLLKPTLTNRDLRKFLGISSIKGANRLLSALNLPHTGSNKGRVYFRPDDFLSQLEERYHRQIQKTKV